MAHNFIVQCFDAGGHEILELAQSSHETTLHSGLSAMLKSRGDEINRATAIFISTTPDFEILPTVYNGGRVT